MLSYNDLTRAQKRWVELVELHFSNILDVSKNILTYKDINEIDNFFRSKRVENKRYKISKPLWLITNNASARGVYKFPASTIVEELVDDRAPVDSVMELNYKAELKKLNIRFKK